MFAGIIEAKTNLLKFAPDQQTTQETRITVQKPSNYNDISIGDSIAVNGVCLTVEAQTENSIQFCLGAETLKVTGFSERSLSTRPIHLERSLKFGDRIHGHIVLGHVDSLCEVMSKRQENGSLILTLKVPNSYSKFLWSKGSVSLQGVSLTINDVTENTFQVCLIPETLRQTHLAEVEVGDKLNLEVDQMARAFHKMFEASQLRTEPTQSMERKESTT